MPGFNQVILMGNVVADPKAFGTRTTAAEFTLAVNEVWYDAERNKQEDVYFAGCKVFGRQADTLLQYARKGTSLHLVGRLSRETWEDKDTGKKREKTRIIVKSFSFTGSRKTLDTSAETPSARPDVGCPDSDDAVPF